MLAIRASTSATTQTSPRVIAEKSGVENCARNSLTFPATGMATIWWAPSTHASTPDCMRALRRMPKATAASGPGTMRKIRNRGASHVSQATRRPREIAVMNTAAGVTDCSSPSSQPAPPPVSTATSPGAGTAPSAWGNCLMMMRSPIPVSIPLMTDVGK